MTTLIVIPMIFRAWYLIETLAKKPYETVITLQPLYDDFSDSKAIQLRKENW